MLTGQGYVYHPTYISRLMKQMNIKSQVKQKHIVTTDSKHNYSLCNNLLDRNFKIDQLGKIWVSDITYLKYKQTPLYLTTIIDLADRKVVADL